MCIQRLQSTAAEQQSQLTLLAVEEKGTHRLCEQARLERLHDQRLLLAGVPGHLRGRWTQHGCDPARQPTAQPTGQQRSSTAAQ